MRKWLALLLAGLFYFTSSLHAAEVRKLGVNDFSYVDFTSPGGKAVKGVQPIDARAYGVLCDNTTDDAAAINAAIAAVTTGGTVLMPGNNAKCLIKSSVNLNKGITFDGQGRSRIADTWNAATMIVPSADFVGDNAINITADHAAVENLTVHGVDGNGAVGIAINGNNARLRNVSVFRMDSHGIRVGIDTSGSNSNSWYFDGVISNYNDGDGFYFHDYSDANAGTCVHCEAAVNGGVGFKLGTAVANTFIGILAEQNTGAGVHLMAGADKNTFVGGDLAEANGGGTLDLDMDSDADYNSLVNVSILPGNVTDGGTSNRIRYPTWGIFKGALVTRSTAKTAITDNTYTTIDFDTATYADGDVFNAATDNTKLIVPDGAKWVRIFMQARFSADNTDGYREIQLFKQASSVEYCNVARTGAIASGDILACTTPPLQVTPGQYFQMKTKSTQGSEYNIMGSYTIFGMEVIQ